VTLSLAIDGVEVVAGATSVEARTRPPFDEDTLALLAALSSALRGSKDAKANPDLATFAFWCRKANTARLKKAFDHGRRRLGRGTVLHIAPSNVAVNFAFSWAFGLLSGNANIVRVPSNPFPQVDIFCDVLSKLLAEPEFAEFAAANAFIRYPRNDAVTARLSLACDARVIWGGDETVSHIRALPMAVHGVEIAFVDRYSFCILDAATVAGLDDKELERLANGFYNDAYLMDQNACSSPHLVVWLGDAKKAQARFWNAVGAVAHRKYGLEPIFAVDKYTDLLETAAARDDITQVERIRNDVYRISLARVGLETETLRGRFGTFYEYEAASLDEFKVMVSRKCQTITYFGVDGASIGDFVVAGRLTGVDRVVPVGQALDMNVIWDGIDVCKTLSRIVDVR
jgi:hypothetical protein